MKNLFCLLCGVLFSTTVVGQSSVVIPPNETIELDYPQYQVCQATIKNKSKQAIEVAVLSMETNEQLRGFGLGKKGKEEVVIEESSKLVLRNNNDKRVTVDIKVNPVRMRVSDQSVGSVNFTLQNSSDETIPLLIPTVMNPNLSPDSMSGVSLKMGQEIFFKSNGRRHVLLIVDDSIKKGDVLDVAMLLPKRKMELGLK